MLTVMGGRTRVSWLNSPFCISPTVKLQATICWKGRPLFVGGIHSTTCNISRWWKSSEVNAQQTSFIYGRTENKEENIWKTPLSDKLSCLYSGVYQERTQKWWLVGVKTFMEDSVIIFAPICKQFSPLSILHHWNHFRVC